MEVRPKNDVNIELVISDGQTRVLEALKQKTQKAIQLQTNLKDALNKNYFETKKEFNKLLIKPKF